MVISLLVKQQSDMTFTEKSKSLLNTQIKCSECGKRTNPFSAFVECPNCHSGYDLRGKKIW